MTIALGASSRELHRTTSRGAAVGADGDGTERNGLLQGQRYRLQHPSLSLRRHGY